MTFKQDWEKAAEQYSLPVGFIEGMVKQAIPRKNPITSQIISGGCPNLNIRIDIGEKDPTYILRVYTRDVDAVYREQAIGGPAEGYITCTSDYTM